MSYRLKIRQYVGAELRRVTDEQLRKALDELSDEGLSREEKTHQVRKRLKKTRAALRLVRPAFKGSYSEENAYFRDADVRLETIENLDTEGTREKEIVETAKRSAEAERSRVAEDAEAKLEQAGSRLSEGRKRVEAWKISGDGFDALAGGLKKTYARAIKARRAAYAEGEAELFHDWRKRVKYHRYHVRLLRAVWPDVFNARRDELKRLSDLLGDDDDLTVLAETVTDFATELDDDGRGTLIDLTCRQKSGLREKAEALGEKLFVEKPKRYLQLVGAIWSVRLESS